MKKLFIFARIFISFSILILFFHNCSNQKDFKSDKGYASSRPGGAGDGFDGKIYASNGDCGGTQGVKSRIGIPDSNGKDFARFSGRPVLMRSDCNDQDWAPFNASEIHFSLYDQAVFEFQGQIFDLITVGSDQRTTNYFCRGLDQDQSAIDFLVGSMQSRPSSFDGIVMQSWQAGPLRQSSTVTNPTADSVLIETGIPAETGYFNLEIFSKIGSATFFTVPSISQQASNLACFYQPTLPIMQQQKAYYLKGPGNNLATIVHGSKPTALDPQSTDTLSLDTKKSSSPSQFASNRKISKSKNSDLAWSQGLAVIDGLIHEIRIKPGDGSQPISCLVPANSPGTCAYEILSPVAPQNVIGVNFDERIAQHVNDRLDMLNKEIANFAPEETCAGSVLTGRPSDIARAISQNMLSLPFIADEASFNRVLDASIKAGTFLREKINFAKINAANFYINCDTPQYALAAIGIALANIYEFTREQKLLSDIEALLQVAVPFQTLFQISTMANGIGHNASAKLDSFAITLYLVLKMARLEPEMRVQLSGLDLTGINSILNGQVFKIQDDYCRTNVPQSDWDPNVPMITPTGDPSDRTIYYGGFSTICDSQLYSLHKINDALMEFYHYANSIGMCAQPQWSNTCAKVIESIKGIAGYTYFAMSAKDPSVSVTANGMIDYEESFEHWETLLGRALSFFDELQISDTELITYDFNGSQISVSTLKTKLLNLTSSFNETTVKNLPAMSAEGLVSEPIGLFTYNFSAARLKAQSHD